MKRLGAVGYARRPLWTVSVILALILILGAGCAPRPASEVSLRLKWILYAGWAGELVALDQGLWAEEGVAVDIKPGGFELDPIKLVAAGSDQIGVAGADQILLAREKGIPLVAFAVQYQEVPVGFVALKESGIERPTDFVGKRVGVKYGTDVEPIYRALMASVGVSTDDLEEVPVKFDISPLYEGLVDVYPGYLTSDLLIPGEMGYEVNTIRASDYGVSVYGNVYFCTEAFLESHRDLIVRFVRGTAEGWNRALKMAPEEVAALAVAANDGLDIEHETDVAAALQPYVMPEGFSFGQMSEEGWRALYSMLRDRGIIETDFDWTSAYTLDVLAEAGL